MKRTLLAVTLVALFLPIARQAVAADVSLDLFYTNLSGGNWVEVEGYGYGWQPDVAVSSPNWRPYADGYWAYTDVGWTWVSYEDFGWATYHYGRWARLTDYGWVWFPGNDPEWGPAWVSWRVGGGYCGWAPLPPRGPGIAFSVGNIGVGVDIDFDIGPTYYNFVDVRYIGEPVLRDRIFAPTQNVTYINQTVNVTNITTTNNVVYNYGPDYNALSAQSSRPIQRLKLDRQQNVDAATAVKSGAITKVQGDKLVVAAPAKIQKPAKAVAPPTVKTKVAQPKIEKGWTGVANEAELKQKIKTEDHKKIPAPGAAATGAAAPQAPMASPAGKAAVSPAATAAGAASAPPATSPFERGKRKGKPGKPGQPAQPAATAAPAFSPGQGMGPPAGSPPGRHKGRAGERPGEQLGATPPTGGQPAGTPEGGPGTHGKAKGFERGTPAQPPASPAGAPNEPPPGKHRGPPATSPTPYSGAGPGAGAERPGAAKSSANERIGGPPGAPRHGPSPQGETAGRRPPGAGTPAPGVAEEHGRGKPEGGKKQKEASPSPSPQY